MSFWVKWFIFTGALFVPSVDLYMDQSMPLHMVVQTLIFLALGWAASARLEKVDFAAIDPGGATGYSFLLGCTIFWMLPRSLDFTLTSEWMDKLFHVSTLLAGFCLRKSLPRASLVLHYLFGFNLVSMLGAMGVFYLAYQSRACTSYTLEEQREAGKLLLAVCGLLFLLLGRVGLKSLANMGPREGEHAPSIAETHPLEAK